MQSVSEFNGDKYQVVCNKQNMPLKINKEENTYMLDFEVQNNNFDLNKLMDFQIYNLIKQLNQDIIEDIEIISQPTNDEIEVLFLFKRFGKNAGVPQKYLFLNTIRQKTDNLILFTSKDSEAKNIDFIKNHDAERMRCNFAKLTILTIKDKVRLNYLFSIDTKEDLPIYMENMIGLMMKKIFYNLKLVLEKSL